MSPILSIHPAASQPVTHGQNIGEPQQVLPGRDYLKPRDTLWLQVMARLAPGISRKTAEAAINTTFQQSLREWAGTLPTQRQQQNMRNEKIELRPGSRGASELRGEFSDPLILLMTMVGVVLLIACANIANLILARASGRQREISVRLALGAARRRLIRQLVTESLLVALMGGVLGICLSAVGTRLLLALVSTDVNDLGLEVPLDYHVLVFTAIISLLTGLAFGLIPAFRGTRLDNQPDFSGQRAGFHRRPRPCSDGQNFSCGAGCSVARVAHGRRIIRAQPAEHARAKPWV
jgi:hypothetical protein